ncbi:MAG: phosphoribosyltransferase family protein [Desulfurococcaceae archaeon]
MKSVFFNEDFAEKFYVFRNREDAGSKLGYWLRDLGVDADIVYGVPAGGIPVALRVAEVLGCKLDVLICRKLLIPWNREAGFGAVAPDGAFFFDVAYAVSLGLSYEDIVNAIREQREEIARRLTRYRCNENYVKYGDRAVVVDDGIAAGFTMRAAVEFLRKLGVSKVLVAVPTCHTESAVRIAKLADAVYCLNPRSTPLYAVADAYQEWRDLEDQDVLEYLRIAKAKGILAYKGDCI